MSSLRGPVKRMTPGKCSKRKQSKGRTEDVTHTSRAHINSNEKHGCIHEVVTCVCNEACASKDVCMDFYLMVNCNHLS